MKWRHNNIDNETGYIYTAVQPRQDTYTRSWLLLHSTTLVVRHSSIIPFIYNPVVMGARFSRSSHTGTVHKVAKVKTLRMDIDLAVRVPTLQDLMGVGT